VRNGRVWVGLHCLEKAIVQPVEFDEDEQLLVVHARAWRRERGRCGICQRRCTGYDAGRAGAAGASLDLGTIRAVSEAVAERVFCAEHGVVVAAVPLARHGAGRVRFFEDQVAWLAVACRCPGAGGSGCTSPSAPICPFTHLSGCSNSRPNSTPDHARH
jgi:transposase